MLVRTPDNQVLFLRNGELYECIALEDTIIPLLNSRVYAPYGIELEELSDEEALDILYPQPEEIIYLPSSPITLDIYKPRRKINISPLIFSLVIVLFLGVYIQNTNASNGTYISASDNVKIVNTGVYKPISEPTISKKVFTEFLQELKSPALSEASSMYNACVSKGCDPAVMAAFFEHESTGGNYGVAFYTKSIGNIRCSSGYTCYSTNGNGSFRSYSSWTDGVKDWVDLLYWYKDSLKLSTIEQIIPTYAPQADNNNEAAYISGVKKRVDNLRSREYK